ncbi:MAG: hypothetical protein ACLU6Y_12425 [Ruminococcus sp.]
MVDDAQECGYESSKWMGQCPGCKASVGILLRKNSVSTGKRHRGGGKSKFQAASLNW